MLTHIVLEACAFATIEAIHALRRLNCIFYLDLPSNSFGGTNFNELRGTREKQVRVSAYVKDAWLNDVSDLRNDIPNLRVLDLLVTRINEEQRTTPRILAGTRSVGVVVKPSPRFFLSAGFVDNIKIRIQHANFPFTLVNYVTHVTPE